MNLLEFLLDPTMLLALGMLVGAPLLLSWWRNMAGNAQTTSQTVAESDFPRLLRRALADLDPAFQAAGFVPIGDWKIKRRGITCWGRYFSIDGGRIIAGIGAHSIGPLCVSRAADLSLTSIYADGSFCQTSHHTEYPADIAQMNAEIPLRFLAGGSRDIRELLEQHEQLLAEQTSDVVPIRPDQIGQINEYAMQLMDWHLYHRGVFKTPPSAQTFLATT